TPNANYNGVVNLSYGVRDGIVSTSATQSFTLAAVNDAPALTGAKAVLAAGTEDTAYTVTQASLLAGFSDVEGSALSVVNLSASNGSLSAFNATTGSWIFTPNANYNGPVSLSYGVSDGTAITPATQSIMLAAVNDAPTLTGTKATLVGGNEDTAYTITQASLLAGFSDVDGNALSVVNLSASNGSLSAFNAVTGSWTFTPNANYSGIVNLSYGVGDGIVSTAVSQSFTLAPVNDAPTLTAFSAAVATVAEDSEAQITLAQLLAQGNEADVDGTVSAFVIKAVSSGSLRIGATAATATAWNATSNNTVDAGRNAYWTPALNANGTLNAFTAVAKDNSGAESATAIQAKVTITAVNDAPTGTVTVSGASTQNQTLTAANTLADVDGLGPVSYQWLANGTAIAGATSAALMLGQAQVGKTLSVRASYTDAQGAIDSMTSAVTAAVANVNDAPTGAVGLLRGGVAVTAATALKQGDVLSAGNTLADADGLGAIGYQWFANGAAIADATAASFTLTQAQVGKTLSMKASYTDGFGAEEAVASAATGMVANVNDAPTGAVSLFRNGTSVTASTTIQQGDTLSAANTLADADGLGALSYQWQRFDGCSWVAINGATADSLTLAPTLAYQSVRLAVAYTDGFGTKESVASAATALVNRLTGTAGADTLAGTAGVDLLEGRAGDDSYTVNNVGDVVHEEFNEGVDTVTSSVDHTIRAYIENLFLTGAALNGTGNAQGNTLTGNSGNNRLMGGFGADTLIGGDGDDVIDGVTGDDASTVWMTVTGDSSAQYYVYGGAVNSLALTDGILPSVAAGQSLRFQGGVGGSINIYVTPGSHADLSGLSVNVGSLYLSGQLADYNQTIDQSTGVYTFSRDLPEGQNESATVMVSDMEARLYFADGYIVLNGSTDTRLMSVSTYVEPHMDNYWDFYTDTYVDTYTETRTFQPIQQEWLVGGAQAWPLTIPQINQGTDQLVGGAGNDSYFVDDAGDVVVENVAEGTDTVKANVSHTLSANVENLTLAGTAAISGTGNALNNTLIGNDAANVLDGGAGADILSGGKGNDTYSFGRGYGADTVQENDATQGNTDVLQFLNDIRADQLWLSQMGNDLEVGIIGTSDKVTVQNWYSGSQNHVEQIKNSDGKVLLDTQVDNLVQAMAGFAPPVMGETSLSASYAAQLAPVLAASWH
ncbi:MAG: cadherin-like domain-containing protein, partial [Pseudomonas sp.]|nr:cadherin-like domain-containing protein [Pseudomonas sp.]